MSLLLEIDDEVDEEANAAMAFKVKQISEKRTKGKIDTQEKADKMLSRQKK